jgi:hypothetical protein
MKTRRLSAAVLVAFLSTTTVTFPALAQGEDAVTVQARARFKEGVDYFDKGQFENARLAFLQAYALKKHPAVLLNLAQSSAKAGHPLEAAKYFQQYLKDATTATPEQRTAAESGLAEVRQKLGRVEIVAPAGMEISLDDYRIGNAPFNEPIDVEVGPHVLKSSTETVKVTAVVGQKVQAKFGATTQAAPPVVAPVVTPPATEPPKTEPKAEPADATEPPNKDYGSEKPGLFSPPETMAPVYVGIGVTVVGIAGIIIFAAAKSDAQKSADTVADQIRAAAGRQGISAKGICSSPPNNFVDACNTLKDNNDKVDTDALLANVSIGVAAVGAATALGWYMFGPKRDSKSAHATTIAPYAGLGTGGINVLGTF